MSAPSVHPVNLLRMRRIQNDSRPHLDVFGRRMFGLISSPVSRRTSDEEEEVISRKASHLVRGLKLNATEQIE